MPLFPASLPALARKPRARCRHKPVRTRVMPFSGPVARRENPRAHGGSCEVETCLACGAERATNLNAGAVERGAWGPSRAEREADEAREAREREARERAAEIRDLRATLIPVRLVARDGRRLTVSVDGEGMVILDGPHRDGDVTDILRGLNATAPGWWQLAQRLRELLVAPTTAATAGGAS